MSTLPGQRAAQRPLRAAVASQRAIGRQLTSVQTLSEELVLWTDEGWQKVVCDDNGRDHLVPYDFGNQEG
ncbi:hypothetical protein [Streptomyces longwoodensis]|uniref:hypothetical protein n=1 Tax=Streptomyces longwoodensis TaxID=68231 RepID=UPI0036F97D23